MLIVTVCDIRPGYDQSDALEFGGALAVPEALQ